MKKLRPREVKVGVYSMTEVVSIQKPSYSRACVESCIMHDRDDVTQNHLILEPV